MARVRQILLLAVVLVALALAPGSATAAIVGPEGGTLEVTGADVRVRITVPAGTSGGELSAFFGSPTATPPTGYTLLGQQIDITAPSATAAYPLVLEFELAAAALPAGIIDNEIVVLRNNAPIPLCGLPAPSCWLDRGFRPNGDFYAVARTTEASAWNLARAPAFTGPPSTNTPGPGTTTGPGGEGTTNPGTETGTGVVPDTAAPLAGLRVHARQRLAAVLRKGLALTARCSEACTLKVSALLDAKQARKLRLPRQIGSVSGKIAGAGERNLTLKFSAKARKALRRQRSVKLTLRTTVADSAGNAGKVRDVRVTLRR